MMKKYFALVVGFFGCLYSLQAQSFFNINDVLIPDNAPPVYSDITVGGLPAVIDTNFGVAYVCLDITHTYDADLTVSLIAPDGTKVMLFSNIGGGDDNFVNTCLDGFSAGIGTGSAPFTGIFKSMGTLGNVNNGQNPNGVWRLELQDTYGQDEGTLLNWSLTFNNQPAMPFVFTSSNLPLVKISTNGQSIPDDPQIIAYMQIIDNGLGQLNFYNQTNYAYQGQIEIELQGFSGTSYPKKNYSIDLIDTLGNKIDTTLLGMPAGNDWIFKTEYTNYSLINNAVTYEMARRMGNYAPRTRFCELFLDGEYMGVFNLTEEVKRSPVRVDIAKLSASDTSGVELSGGYIVEMNINGEAGAWNSAYPPINNATCTFPVEFKHVYPKASAIHPTQHDYIRSYIDSFENVLTGPNFLHPTQGYRSMISVKSFIDFLIVNEFSVNYDSYGRSTYMYKEKDTDGGQLFCAPSWDYDRAYDFNYPNSAEGWVYEITHPYWPFPFWWSRFNDDIQYQRELTCRWMMLRQDVLSDSAFESVIDSMAGYIHDAAERNYIRWAEQGVTDYGLQVDSMKSFLSRRLAWMDNELIQPNFYVPSVMLPADTVMCEGGILNGFMGSQYEYHWLTGEDTALLSIPQSGNYTLTVENTYGCYNSASTDVIISLPDAQFTSIQVMGPQWSFLPAVVTSTQYSWDFGDGSSSALIAPTHTYTINGTYPVTLTVVDSLGCSTTTTQNLQIQNVGIGELPTLPFAVYPNPFSQEINMIFSEPIHSPLLVTLQDITGKSVYEQRFSPPQTNCLISVPDVPQGVYTLLVKTATAHHFVKLIK